MRPSIAPIAPMRPSGAHQEGGAHQAPINTAAGAVAAMGGVGYDQHQREGCTDTEEYVLQASVWDAAALCGLPQVSHGVSAATIFFMCLGIVLQLLFTLRQMPAQIVCRCLDTDAVHRRNRQLAN